MSWEFSPIFLLNLSNCEMYGEERHFYQFQSFRLNVEERQLLHDKSRVPLRPKAFDVLTVLVERNGHLVEKDELMKLVWADLFVEEANIARIIHTLRKALGEEEDGHKFIETVAKKGYRFIADVTEIRESVLPNYAESKQNFPNFVENTISDQSEIIIPSEVSPKRKMRFILFTTGFLSAVFLIFLLSFYFKSATTANPGRVKSIAVLPFKPISTANRDEIYEIGIADSLIHRLSTAKNFTVRPLSATRKYTAIEQDPIVAGREQKVDFVLASNYQLVNGKIRITSQLFNVSNGRIEETFQSSEIDAVNVFTMQDIIAVEVGNKLILNPLLAPESPGFRWKLGNFGFFADTFEASSSRIGTKNEEAYRLFLQGKNLTMKRNSADHKKAVEYFEQAIRLDPNFARPYARMAHAYLWSSFDDNGAVRAEKVRSLINKALELDNHLAEAYVTRADLELVYDWDFSAVEKDLNTAIELEPNNDTAHWVYALLLAYRGQFDEALRKIDTAQEINPGAVMYMRDRGRILYYARRYDEALVELKRAVDLDENMNSGWLRLVYEAKGDEKTAYEIFIKNQKRSNPDSVEIYQKIFAGAGWNGVKRKFLESAKLGEQKVSSENYVIALLSAGLGEREQAFEYLNRAFEQREWRMIMLNVDPSLDSLRDDPRFGELVRCVGLK